MNSSCFSSAEPRTKRRPILRTVPGSSRQAFVAGWSGHRVGNHEPHPSFVCETSFTAKEPEISPLLPPYAPFGSRPQPARVHPAGSCDCCFPPPSERFRSREQPVVPGIRSSSSPAAQKVLGTVVRESLPSAAETQDSPRSLKLSSVREHASSNQDRHTRTRIPKAL